MRNGRNHLSRLRVLGEAGLIACEDTRRPASCGHYTSHSPPSSTTRSPRDEAPKSSRHACGPGRQMVVSDDGMPSGLRTGTLCTTAIEAGLGAAFPVPPPTATALAGLG